MIAKSRLGWPLLLTLSFSPLVLWYFSLLPFSDRLYNLYSIFTTVGQVCGLIGITMYALTLILSSRMEWFEDFFGGMNRVYIVHHILGGVAFIMLMIHPLFLLFSRLTLSARVAAEFLLPSSDWTINLGQSALLLMMSILIITFFVKLPYHIWKWIHKFMGAVFMVGVIHAFFVSSDVIRYNPLKYYLLVIVSLGILAYLYRTVFGRFLVSRTKYTIDEVIMEKDKVTQVNLSPQKKPIKVKPGQFMFIGFKSAGVSNEVHPFTVSKFSPDGKVSISAKDVGDYTATLKNLKAGETAAIEGAYGRFTNTLYRNKKQIWIAGGIGITPFLSMAQNLANIDYEVTLYYSIRNPEEAVYLNDLTEFANSNAKFHVVPFYTATQGRLSAEVIGMTMGDMTVYDFFLCGPPPMMKSMREQLKKMKVKERSIHSEEFSIW